MSSEAEQQRYSYRFSLSARKVEDDKGVEESRAEVQTYVNEILGIARTKAPMENRT
jgi:hypothetical protein